MDHSDEKKPKWSERDISHYFDVLTGMDAVLYHLRRVLEDHRDCDGCDLCIAAQGAEYTMDIYNDLFMADAPAEARHCFRLEFEPDPEPQPTPTHIAAKPPAVAKAKPYWIP